MDELNRQIVGYLLRDGRATFQEIGSAVGLSAPAVKRRVDLMRARGQIAGFTAVVDPHVLGWEIEAYVEIFCRGNVTPEALARDLGDIPEVVEVATVTGDADAIIHVMAASMAGIEASVERIRSSGRVERTRTSVVMSRVIDRPARPTG
ncbi:transcriptional regulator, AsnC family [Xylanimonas cellulosilytica DSM 15894]|uniref:Transcriptional regulator, AsnC family n=1 Tax=Xylanimonas cellulosilytica (strain DSM 15894 / JCM 12276 / CECT 5975 / KCTC 9989 / LMG 20990 / NBRC 107835 / XIL07) TaxID=446471 RepID=D1BRN9_XYLCX|nr:Lrp/AsnC family transcriptional regulator [Xylanimonas cellulosilytica]ACZ32305.1 transcriptional regulator, AsnC family [Xylanimonas cellulosilytica DSM 15894]